MLKLDPQEIDALYQVVVVCVLVEYPRALDRRQSQGELSVFDHDGRAVIDELSGGEPVCSAGQDAEGGSRGYVLEVVVGVVGEEDYGRADNSAYHAAVKGTPEGVLHGLVGERPGRKKAECYEEENRECLFDKSHLDKSHQFPEHIL